MNSQKNKGYPRRVREKYGEAGVRPEQRPSVAPSQPTSHENIMTSRIPPQNESAPGESRPPPTLAEEPAANPIESTAASSGAPLTDSAIQPPSLVAEDQNTEVAGTDRKVEKNEKRAEPQNVAEFVEAFYAGRVKALADATIRRLKNSAIVLDASTRGALLRNSMLTDRTLDKTRRLMLIATEVTDLKLLGHLLFDFAADVVTYHSALRANGMQARLFPNYDDQYALEDAWIALCALTNSEESRAAKVGQDPVRDGVADKVDGEPDVQAEEQREEQREARVRHSGFAAARTAQLQVNKARRNALLCSLIWRVHKKHASFAEAMRALRTTLFRPPVRSATLEAELLEAIALMPEKEDPKVALLLEWQSRQQADLVNRLSEATRQAESLSTQVGDLQSQVANGLADADRLEKELAYEKVKKRELDVQIGVVQTHGQADYEALRAMSLRIVRDSASQLEDVSKALLRSPPKVEFAREVLDTIVDSLKATSNKLVEA